MGQLRTGNSLADFDESPFFPDSSAQPQDPNLDKRQKDFIYISAKNIGVDLMMATDGELITEDHLNSLFFTGYLDYSSAAVLGSSYFDSLEDYNADVRAAYERKLARRKARDDKVLEEIANSEIPPLLFNEIEFVAIEGRSLKRQRKTTTSTLKDIGVIKEDEVVDDKTKIQRFVRYKMAKQLLEGIRSDVTERRLVGIALGIHIGDEEQNGKKSLFQSEIQKSSNGKISAADIEIAADSAKIYDYIYPDRQRKYLAELQEAATTPIVLPIHEAQSVYQINTPEVYLNSSRRELLVGRSAVKAALNNGDSESVHLLSSLLGSSELEFNFADPNHYKYKGWDRSSYLQYGQWLLGIITPADIRLRNETLFRSAQLGLGPGPKAIRPIFGSNALFFRELSSPGRIQKGLYDDWDFEDFVQHIQRVAQEEGARPTQKMLLDRINRGMDEPLPSMIIAKAGSMRAVMEAAGFEHYNRRLSRAEILENGVHFFRINGRLPVRRDFYHDSGLRSYKAMRNHFGNLLNFQAELEDEVSRALAA